MTKCIPGLTPDVLCLARLSSRSGLLTDFRRVMENGGSEKPDEIRRLVMEENLLARATTSARSKLYKELKGRYLLDPGVPLFTLFLDEWARVTISEEKNLLAFVLLALNDRTVMLTSCEWLFPHLRKAGSDLRVGDLETFFASLGKTSHPEVSKWTESTLKRVVQHYLATVRDCGLAQGAIRKRAHRPALYAAPVRLLLRALQIGRFAPAEIIVHESFKILGIAPGEVVGELSELNRQGAISFRQQADVIELTL